MKAGIWFNKICQLKHLSPEYVNTTISGSNEQSINTKEWSQLSG
jgi:hypothetical protein